MAQATLLARLPQLNQRKIVLASASPRRSDLLKQIGLTFQVVESQFVEDLPKDRGGRAYAQATALGKARAVAHQLGARGCDLVIAADTVVQLGEQVLEKPRDATHAREMLSALSGRKHEVHTGVALVLPSGQEHSFTETTEVHFGGLGFEDIDAYVTSGEPFGKAGAYGIQGAAAVFVERLEGCYFNVVGLPIHRLSQELVGLMASGALKT